MVLETTRLRLLPHQVADFDRSGLNPSYPYPVPNPVRLRSCLALRMYGRAAALRR